MNTYISPVCTLVRTRRNHPLKSRPSRIVAIYLAMSQSNNPTCPKHIAGRAGASARNYGAGSHNDSDRAKATSCPEGNLPRNVLMISSIHCPDLETVANRTRREYRTFSGAKSRFAKPQVEKYKQDAVKRVPGEIRSIQIRNKDSNPTAVDSGFDPEPKKAVSPKGHGVETSFEDLPLIVEINGAEEIRGDNVRFNQPATG